MKPKYPLFIVSKGRWESNYTHKALAKMQVKHFMIVELQEYDFYKETTDEDYCTIMLLNHNYQTNYDTCWIIYINNNYEQIKINKQQTNIKIK